LSIPTPTLRLTLDGEPCSIRISSASLAELEGARRAKAEERLRAEGFAEAQATAAGAMERAAAALDEERGGLIGSVAENAALLAVEIAQQLLRKSLAEGNYDIAAIVREVLASTGGTSGTTLLRVHPADAEALAEVPFRAGTQVQADPAVRRGDVMVETDQGVLVREIDGCVATIREKLEEALRP